MFRVFETLWWDPVFKGGERGEIRDKKMASIMLDPGDLEKDLAVLLSVIGFCRETKLSVCVCMSKCVFMHECVCLSLYVCIDVCTCEHVTA